MCSAFSPKADIVSLNRPRPKSANFGRRHTRLSDRKADAVAGECQATLGIGGNRRSTGED